MRTIEDADDAWGWQFALDPPEVRCSLSSSVGALKALILTPCGSTIPIACRITPPLPEVSIPCRITSTLGCSRGIEYVRRRRRSHHRRGARPWGSPARQPRPCPVARRRAGVVGRQIDPPQGPARSRLAGGGGVLDLGGIGSSQAMAAFAARAPNWGCEDAVVRMLYPRSNVDRTGEIDDADLADLYRHPRPMEECGCGRTSSPPWTARSPELTDYPGINTASDHHVFALHRALADVDLVGAGTCVPKVTEESISPAGSGAIAPPGLRTSTLAVVSVDVEPRPTWPPLPVEYGLCHDHLCWTTDVSMLAGASGAPSASRSCSRVRPRPDPGRGAAGSRRHADPVVWAQASSRPAGRDPVEEVCRRPRPYRGQLSSLLLDQRRPVPAGYRFGCSTGTPT